jgi:hypothetical protein
MCLSRGVDKSKSASYISNCKFSLEAGDAAQVLGTQVARMSDKMQLFLVHARTLSAVWLVDIERQGLKM